MTITFENGRILAAILGERTYQDRKYGSPQERDLSISDYLAILQKEVNEVGLALGYDDKDAAMCEMLQVAAVAWACLQRHGVVERAVSVEEAAR